MFALRAILFASYSLLVSVMGLSGWVGESNAFIGLTVGMVAFLVNEIRLFLKERRGQFASPVVLSSIYIFVLNFGIGNFVYFAPDYVLSLTGVRNPGFEYMNRFMLLVAFSGIAMWAGERSFIGSSIGYGVRLSRWWSRFERKDFGSINWGFITVLVVTASLARIAMFWMGVYGYGSNYDALIASGSIRQYYVMLSMLGQIALAGVAFHKFYMGRATRGYWLVGVLGIEVLWGFLSGFKGQVVIPFAIVALCSLIVNRRVPFPVIGAAVSMMFVAYVVIEPYRRERFAIGEFDSTNITQTAGILLGSARGEVSDVYDVPTTGVGVFWGFSARMSMTEMGTRAVMLKDMDEVGYDAPPFFQNMVLSPVYAFVPRLLWPSKPELNAGAWFYKKVFQNYESNTSLGLSTVGYLYLAGGGAMVFAGFFVLGLFHRVTEIGFGSITPGSCVVMLGCIYTLVLIDSEFYAFIVTYLRYLPMLVVLQYMMFRK